MVLLILSGLSVTNDQSGECSSSGLTCLFWMIVTTLQLLSQLLSCDFRDTVRVICRQSKIHDCHKCRGHDVHWWSLNVDDNPNLVKSGPMALWHTPPQSTHVRGNCHYLWMGPVQLREGRDANYFYPIRVSVWLLKGQILSAHYFRIWITPPTLEILTAP